MKKEMELKSLDIFCEIIDNFGDIGVVYRLGKEFKKVFGENVKIRVILNRLDEFININSNVKNIQNQEIDGIQYVTYEYVKKNMCTFSTANVIIEAFGCTIPEEYMNEAYDNSDLLINLEYLSAEDWIESCHLQESPSGKGKLKKIFFMPGFTEKSGGVIADSLYLDRIKNVIENKEYYRKKYFSEIENIDKKIIGTVFSYEKNFTPLFRDLKSLDKEIVILAMGEKTQEGFKNFFEKNFIEKLENKAISKSDQIQKYAYWGLLLFVGIPLPGTGAWTGALIASLLNMDVKKSFGVIVLGVVLAGIIISVFSYGLLGMIIK